jgi:hypothetical protein
MSLDGGAQVILQSETTGGVTSCVGFKGLPVFHPAFIALVHAGSPQAAAHAEALRQELERELQALDVPVRRVPLSRHGTPADPAGWAPSSPVSSRLRGDLEPPRPLAGLTSRVAAASRPAAGAAACPDPRRK